MLYWLKDPSVRQATGGTTGQGGMDDYNPFEDSNKTRPAAGVCIFMLLTTMYLHIHVLVNKIYVLHVCNSLKLSSVYYALLEFWSL